MRHYGTALLALLAAVTLGLAGCSGLGATADPGVTTQEGRPIEDGTRYDRAYPLEH
jgi:ABC-type glycerol-3-phosphate transport system substrate-binding protein